MKKETLFYLGLILVILAIFLTMIWGLRKEKVQKEKDFLECVQATECYRCVSVSGGMGTTAEYCGLEQNPFFQKLDQSNFEWCYNKFIK